jgi:hypothetical protein
MTDPEQALLFLLESFPEENVSVVRDTLRDCEYDFERAAGVLIEQKKSKDLGFLPQLAEMFPDVGIADIAAFLAQQSPREGLTIDDLAIRFMSGGIGLDRAGYELQAPKSQPLSLSLSEFRSVVLDGDVGEGESMNTSTRAFGRNQMPALAERFSFTCTTRAGL